MSAQQTTEGYDVGVCSAHQFVALHVAASDKDVVVQFVSLGPDRVDKLERPQIYKFDKEGVNGLLYVDGEKAAKFYGGKAADESGLKETAFVLYQMCLQMHEASGASTS